MNLSLQQAMKFCNAISSKDYSNRLIIAPPAPYLACLADMFPSIDFCSQNVAAATAKFGSFTGQYSAEIVKSCGVNYSLIGHSEYRSAFSESDSIIKQKTANCLAAEICPIICIGESQEVRKNNQHKEFLAEQLANCLPCTDKRIIIAYEPLWAIGTGIVPSVTQLLEIFELMESFLRQSQVANNVSLVYGGSVNVDNFKNMLNLPHMAGLLVGRASLNDKDLPQMLNKNLLP